MDSRKQGDDALCDVTCESQSSGKRLTRTEAARLMGVSVSTLRRKEGGDLTPIVDGNGVHTFDEAEVRSLATALRRKRAGLSAADGGDVAADVFELLDDGAHLVDIVKRLRISPDAVALLHRQWLEMRGGIAFSATQVEEVTRILTLHAPVTRAAQVLDSVRRRLDASESAAQRASARYRAASRSRQSMHEEHGPLGTVNVGVERRDGADGPEIRIAAGVHWLDPISDGNVAQLHSDWYSPAQIDAEGLGDLVSVILRRGRLGQRS